MRAPEEWYDGFVPLDVEGLLALPDDEKLEVFPLLVDAAQASEAARFPPERDYYKAVQRWERLDLTVTRIRHWWERRC